jgi:hypothetical protein
MLRQPEINEDFVKEIRLCWRGVTRRSEDSVEAQGGPWMTRSPESVAMLTDLREAGCEAFGEDSHWVEEREWSLH